MMEQAAMLELYDELGKGVRSYFLRRFGMADLDDRIHNLFLAVVEAVDKGKVLQADHLGGFALGMARMQTRRYIRTAIDERRRSVVVDFERMAGGSPGPERQAIERQRLSFVRRGLRCLPIRQCEVLRRSLESESKDEICAAMDLSATEFRLAKSRGLARVRERFPKAA
jgi:DNA-directed RNA polymerase specialized sigma24 family protein